MNHDEKVSLQLSVYSEVVSQIRDVPLALYDAGLHLLSTEFDGPVEGRELRSTWVTRELLRERFGQWSVHRGEDRFESVGYRSSQLDAELDAMGVTRLNLEDPTRPERVDSLIAAKDWGWEFDRARLLWSRSNEMSDAVRREKAAEAQRLGLSQRTTVDPKSVRREVKGMFSSLGYRTTQAMRPEGFFVRRHGGCLIVWCTLDALSGWGANIQVQVCPALNLEGTSDELRRGFERAHYFDMCEALVKGFGRYRGGVGPEGIDLMMHAYTEYLQRILPLLEDAAANAVAQFP
ncbi:hypothetical protein [Stenotrophomonas cyclobalanopsidis]|uniref:hypothetical protein n=1 Tax=Stenotrophomonas cyclobalanopsidis TaxID=2771362 RepID=UPI0034602E3C